MKTIISILPAICFAFFTVSPTAVAQNSVKKKSVVQKKSTNKPVKLKSVAPPAQQIENNYARHPEAQKFIAEMVREHGFNETELRSLFANVKRSDRAIELMDAPVRRPAMWHEYIPRFMSDSRIEDGVAFARKNAQWLQQAEAQYGVPASVIVAIIGVETFYGRVTGGFSVLDVLTTLAFDYPRRADFFKGELRHFLLLNREVPSVALSAKGSFAGAMGLPQFMPGSYRNYAVDFDKDGKIDLFHSPADIIGSVAAYFVRHGWQSGQPVWSPLVGMDASSLPALDGGLSARMPVKAFVDSGIPAAQNVPPDSEAAILMLEESDGSRYYLAYNNWYVITRYNRSRLYASAVWTLAEAIKARM